jgi:hypothetical protein
MLRSVCVASSPLAAVSSAALVSVCGASAALTAASRGKKFIAIPSGDWDASHEDINAHVKRRVPGETRDERSKRFAREWRNVELELGINKDSRGRELRYRKTYVYRYTYPNSFDDHWMQSR